MAISYINYRLINSNKVLYIYIYILIIRISLLLINTINRDQYSISYHLINNDLLLLNKMDYSFFIISLNIIIFEKIEEIGYLIKSLYFVETKFVQRTNNIYIYIGIFFFPQFLRPYPKNLEALIKKDSFF